MSPLPTLDLAQVAALRELFSDLDQRLSLVASFTDHAKESLDELGTAIGAADAAGMARVAHSLAGSSSTFGAVALAWRCQELETRVNNGDIVDAVWLAELEQAVVDAVAALEAAMGTLEG